MASTELNVNLQEQKWLSNYFVEYVRTSGFNPYMGSGVNSVIQVKRELTSGGKSINLPLITRLKGAGVTGYTTLAGSEEALGNFHQKIDVDYLRNAVRIRQPDERWSNFDLLRAAGDALRVWAADKLREDIITALGSINGVAYGDANATQKNAWTAANEDRVIFGAERSNFNATHATALGAIAAGEKLSAAVVSLMKRIAKTADPHIRPIRTTDSQGREFFVMFAGSMAFRDLKTDSVMQQANREARPRDVAANPIFQDGDLIYDGVIIREIPEIPATGTVGAASARVEPVYLCGAQALGCAWGQMPTTIRDDFDYRHEIGIGTQEVRGIQKMRFGTGAASALKDHGMVTGFVAAAADV